MRQLCQERPAAPECAFIRQRHGDQLGPITETPVWVHDSRIRAAVIVAPAIAYLFGGGGLKHATIPVQLWRAAADGQAPDAWNSAVVRSGLPITLIYIPLRTPTITHFYRPVATPSPRLRHPSAKMDRGSIEPASTGSSTRKWLRFFLTNFVPGSVAVSLFSTSHGQVGGNLVLGGHAVKLVRSWPAKFVGSRIGCGAQ